MEQSPSTNIYNMIRNSGVIKNKSRQEFLVEIINSVIKSKSVVFSEIADKMDKDIKVSSIERRIQDFFQKVTVEYQNLAAFLLSFIPHEKLQLCIDRTEWDFGKTQVNILCIVASIGKMAVPIYFELLDNNSGNSGWEDRIEILKKIIGIVGKDRIKILLMDREFIGQKWLSWLKNMKIPFVVRVPKHHTILFANGRRKTAEHLLIKNKSFYASNVVVDGVSVNVSLSYNKEGELIYLIGTIPSGELKNWYKKRWGIEVFFQALKGRGFNIEKSSLKNLEKYRKLFAVVSIAYTICWAVGIEAGKENAVRVKKHGYPQYSVFRRGLNIIRNFLKQRIEPIINQAIEKAIQRFLLFLKTVG